MDDKKEDLPLERVAHDLHISDNETLNENIASVLRNLNVMRRQQLDSSLKSLNEENFSSMMTSLQSSSFTTLHSTMAASTTTSSGRKETTGGNEMQTENDESKKESTPVLEVSACPIGKALFVQQQKNQQQQSIASSSSSSLVSTSETVKRTKTLSFLHNEDLFNTTGNLFQNNINCGNDEKSSPSTLLRSMSFQERRQQQVHLKRVESGRELKSSSSNANDFRKVAIISPKHSIQDITDRMKCIQQQIFGSSELSL
jgi:ribosomal protein L12E/L44/L45/RPP1/RPP2